MDGMIPAWVDGVLTPVEKLDAHVRGLRHKAISVFMIDGEKTLIQQRAMGKYHTPGLWANTCCTHPHWDEASEACAHRRLREELGVERAALTHAGQVEYRADVGGGLIEHEVVEIYRAELAPGARITPNPDEVMDVAWISFDALAEEIDKAPKAFTPWLRIYMKEHFAEIVGELT